MQGQCHARWRPAAAAGALACALAAAPAALAAPPVISGADDEIWNRPPEYTVTGDPDATYWWTSTAPQLSFNRGSPFTIRLPQNIRDGRHTILVWTGRDSQGEDRTESARRTFVVDRTPPGPLTITGASTIAAGQPVTFGWSGGEAGARFSWRVDAPTGQIQGPVETTSPVASPAPLQPGAYTLVVRQIDAAGNAGPEAAAAFSIVSVPPAAPASPAPAPAAPSPIAAGALPLPTGPALIRIALPSQNAGRLTPRRAAVVRTRRPMLRWKRGPRGTRLYNVQIFRVDTSRMASSNAVRLRKLRSVFPRRNRMRAPRLVLGACYVWRVWPYRTDDFTKRPLGVSNFCVAPRRRR
ncbi:hypothetical protein [Miltoncostaea marina]|uniref:hypothetical protein n=1 Tax=Miltoncostaea marina TaxID=2843215 RepID=UPI001C3DE6AF|nr:hypothetical protein [Miltoncostaea marina]